MPKILLLAQLLIFSCFSAYSNQQPAQMATLPAYEKLPDTARVNRLNAIAAEHLKEQVFDSVELFSKHAIKLSEKIGYKFGLSIALANLAKVHYMRGDYTPALTATLRSLRLAEALHFRAGEAICLNLVGLIHLAQGKRKLSLEEFNRALVINNALGDQYRLSTNYFNMGLAYNELEQSDSALVAFRTARDISTKAGNRNMQAMASNRLGDTFFKRNQIDTAMQYFESVLNNKAYQNDWENSFAYTGLAQCFQKRGLYTKAVTYAMSGLELAEKKQTKWDAERALRVLYQSYAALNKYEEAYRYLLLDKAYNDSLLNASKEKELNALHLTHQKAVNQVLLKENQIAQQRNKSDRQIVLLSALIILLLVFLVAVLYWNARVKNQLNKRLLIKSKNLAERKEQIKRQNSELNELNRTKDQLFSIISHDLRSPFAAILGMLQLLKTVEVEKEELHYLLDRLYEQTAATSAMTDNLLVWAKSQQEGISVQQHQMLISDVMTEVLLVFRAIAKEKNIDITQEQNDDVPACADRDHVKIILQNLVANAVKFTPSNGMIWIRHIVEADRVCVSIRDNGVGMSSEKLQQLFHLSGKDISTGGTNNETGIGIGLILVKKFVDANRAELHIHSRENEGTEFRVCFQKYLPGA